MLSLCFHSFSSCDWSVASSHEFDENIQLNNESSMNFLLFDRLFSSYLFWILEIDEVTSCEKDLFGDLK